MFAVSQGRLVALSTPFGQRGWFYAEWKGSNSFKKAASSFDPARGVADRVHAFTKIPWAIQDRLRTSSRVNRGVHRLRRAGAPCGRNDVREGAGAGVD